MPLVSRSCPQVVGAYGAFPASLGVRLPRAEGAGALCHPWDASASMLPLGAGVAGCNPSQRLSQASHLHAPRSGPHVYSRVAHRRRQCGASGDQAGGRRGCSGAEQGRAGDAQQPSLVPRSGSWARLTPGVRLPSLCSCGACISLGLWYDVGTSRRLYAQKR